MQSQPSEIPPRRPGLPPRPPMMPRPPAMIPRHQNIHASCLPLGPRGPPPDLGPPNGDIIGIRNQNLQPPPLRPAGNSFSSVVNFSSRAAVDTIPSPSPKSAPAANTTLAKPPIFDKNGQPWLEACSASGKIYFFNARTRETRWSKPETFEEAEAKKTKTMEEIVSETKAELLAEDAVIPSDEEMKVDVSEIKPKGTSPKQDEVSLTFQDIEMKPLPIIEIAPIKVMEKEVYASIEVLEGPSQHKENNSSNQQSETYSSTILEENNSPFRPIPIDVDQLPPVMITKYSQDDKEMGQTSDEERKRSATKKKLRLEEDEKGKYSIKIEINKPNSLVAISQQHKSSSEDNSSGDERESTRMRSRKKKQSSLKANSELHITAECSKVKDIDMTKGTTQVVTCEENKIVTQPIHQFGPLGMQPTMPMFGLPPHLMRPPSCIPPPGFPGFPPRMPTTFLGGPSRFPAFPGLRFLPPDFVPKTVGDWTEHRLPDGRLYYYNDKLKESKWDKPSEFEASDKKDESKAAGDSKGVSPKKDEDIVLKDEKNNLVLQSKDEDKKESNITKPVASRSIVGTGWHLVWTGDGKVFFFNPSSKTSIWERPKELKDNSNVDDILSQGPKDMKADEKEPEKIVDTEKENVSNKLTGVAEKLGREMILEPENKKKQDSQDRSIGVIPIIPNDVTNKNESVLEKKNEIEVRKAIIPLEERMTMFTNLLKERDVSAFSTWEKELHKIVYDNRYLLLSMKERKQCFEKYVKIRAVEERKERIQKLRERKDNFKKLLEEAVSSARITFSDFANKNSKDMRFKAIDKMKDRESLFNDFMIDFRKHEKERLRIRDEKLKTQFFELLSELSELHEASQWKKVRFSIESDRRYELVGSSSKREQFFNEYIQQLDSKRISNTENKSPLPPPPTDDEESVKRPPSPEGDPDSTDRNERINASIRKREEEVRAQKEVYEKDREKEREMHQYDKAVQHFKALLADMVKESQFTWKETRRLLRKDPRWVTVEVLDKEEKEYIFDEHIKEIRDKKKKSFKRLLDESNIPLDAEWREIRKKVKEDQRYIKFSGTESKEEEFNAYMMEKTMLARTEFRNLLQECKLITYKSKILCEENPNHIKDIHATLKKDKRYLIMSALVSERDTLLATHIEELHKRGPPPPPTATNPGARYMKKE